MKELAQLQQDIVALKSAAMFDKPGKAERALDAALVVFVAFDKRLTLLERKAAQYEN